MLKGLNQGIEMTYQEDIIKSELPAEGSIWKAPNRIWNNSFARNKSDEGLHPALIERVKKDNQNAILIPGTSKDYRKGSCVFKIRFYPFSRMSYFLMKLSMTMDIESIKQMDQGWHTKKELNKKQIIALRWQLKMCKGISTN